MRGCERAPTILKITRQNTVESNDKIKCNEGENYQKLQ